MYLAYYAAGVNSCITHTRRARVHILYTNTNYKPNVWHTFRGINEFLFQKRPYSITSLQEDVVLTLLFRPRNSVVTLSVHLYSPSLTGPTGGTTSIILRPSDIPKYCFDLSLLNQWKFVSVQTSITIDFSYFCYN